MTQRSVTYLKGKFETGDIPVQADYGDLIDSFLNLETSAVQTLSGGLNTPAAVSADSFYPATKLINSHTVNVSAGLGTQAGATRITKDVSYVYGNDILGFGIVMASAEPGRIQVVVNTNTTVLTVYPASGCNFIGTAENAPIALAKNSTMTIAHAGVSAYGVTRGAI